ncbi:phosphodiester glycosidase family protein [Paenibacillus sp. SEL3]
MGQATFNEPLKIAGLYDVSYISADVRDVSVQSISGNVRTSPYPGVNGTFFNGTTGELLGIAVGRQGNPVRTGGHKTPKGYRRGTFFCYNPEDSTADITCSSHVVEFPNEYPGLTRWINWAIGGLSLHLDLDLNSRRYYSMVRDEEHTDSIGSFGPGQARPRTLIGYKPSNKRVVLAYVANAEVFDARGVLRELGCTTGVMLDSGSSSQIKAKPSDRSQPVNLGSANLVYNMVAVNPSSWA